MHACKPWVTLFAVILLSSCSSVGPQSAQRQPTKTSRPLQVEELGGGSVITNLGYGIQVNKGSTLQRRWFVINDPSSPVRLSGTGINVVYVSSSIGGDYEYKAAGLASAGETYICLRVAVPALRYLGRTYSHTK